MVAAAVVGSAVVGGVASSMASGKQADAAGKAADQSAEAAAQMRADLTPYNDLGKQAINPLWAAMGYNVDDKGGVTQNPDATLQQKFAFDPANLENTPGYQFTLQQGLKGTNNALAAQGLGLSGAQAKGLSQYTTGLANQTYGDQYNRALSTFNTNYQVAANNVNNLQNLVNTGQNSAAQSGQQGVQAANNAGNYLTQQGNAQAAGIAGIGQAANNGVNNYMLYNALYK
ncbi:hypothetical protein YA0721_03780 [Pseudomonas carnis]|uniref:hypothetical protein n=1 Tax=Pseudomonas carnis TaxID=2487355 RepID=UPI0018E65C07|nr:hypothetical protein [Pseudomonas carnis]MBI6654968.1 hypothetical protein [Pseudomonas carnis]MBI6660170.1 hypothetical protein [Pseudomonas carnis]MBI6687175.1 hypothetical protein [Pseudomonas carnis]